MNFLAFDAASTPQWPCCLSCIRKARTNLYTPVILAPRAWRLDIIVRSVMTLTFVVPVTAEMVSTLG